MSKSASTVTSARLRDGGFRAELLKWYEPFRQSLGRLLSELGSPATPRALQNQVGASYTTCWRVFRIARAGDGAAEAQHAPSPGELKKLLASACENGASAATAAAVATAASQFRKFVTRHAEDRSTFDTMVADGADGPSDTIILQRRRTAYKAVSQLWGLQTDLHCLTFFVGPPAANDRVGHEGISLSLQRGVRRLRADAHVVLMGHKLRNAGAFAELPTTPIDATAAAEYGIPLLPEFSSTPLPRIEPVTTAAGWRLFRSVGGDVGLRSNVEFATGEHLTILPAETAADGRLVYSMSFTTNRKPVAALAIDLIVHRASWPAVRPQSLVSQYEEADFTLATAEQSQRFPGDEKVQSVGRADALHLIGAPRYSELLHHAATSKGWTLSDFDGYRMHVRYPLMGTTTRVYFIAEPPDPARSR